MKPTAPPLPPPPFIGMVPSSRLYAMFCSNECLSGWDWTGIQIPYLSLPFGNAQLSLQILFLKDKWWLELNLPDLAPHRWFITDLKRLNPKRLSLPPLSQGRLPSIHQRGVALMCGPKQCQIKHFTNMWLALVCYWYFGLLRTMHIHPTLKISIWIAYLMSPPLSRNLETLFMMHRITPLYERTVR